MTAYENLQQEIEHGISGKNDGLPIGLPRANKYIGLRRGVNTAIISATGMGKSSMLQNNYILNPVDHYLQNKHKPGVIKPKIFLFSMERPEVYTVAKWMSRKIFLDQGILVPVGKMLGWWEEKLTMDEKNLIHEFKWYIDEIIEGGLIDIISGPQNPTGVYRHIKNYAESKGRIEHLSEYKKIYIPEDNTELVVVALDHFGLMRLEKGLNTKKEAIDKTCEYMQFFRDLYNYSCVGVSQLNRDIASPVMLKMGDVEPSLETIKESGRIAEDFEIVISVFDPLRYDFSHTLEKDKLGYEPYKMEDKQTGSRYYRRIKILKNSYSVSDLGIGACLHGPTGILCELPKVKDITDNTYESILSNSYFLK